MNKIGTGASPTPGSGPIATLRVRVVPAATAGVTSSSSSISVSEADGAGRSDTYTVVLDSQPTHNVSITVTTGTPAAALVSGPGGTASTSATLTFTTDNWSTAQQVTVTAVDDNVDQRGNHRVAITHRATSADTNYDNISISDVTVTVVRVLAAGPKVMQAGWLTRWGRTLSQQVVTALQHRFTAHPEPGLHVTVAGASISSATALQHNQQALSKVLGFEHSSSQQVVAGSAFSFSPQAVAKPEGGAPQLAVWGRGALSSFSGQEDGLSSLEGEVSTALVGADWSRERWRAGAALSHSWGSGSYGGEGDTGADGDITTTLTGIFPYGRYGLTPRLGIWAVAGTGWGQLSLEPDGAATATEHEPGASLRMAAIGMDGLLLDGGDGGISVTTSTDVLMVHTTSEEVDGLQSSEGSVSRLRWGLEAVRPFPLADGASLTPSLAMGIRQDGGDAETGYGVDLVAGIRWHDPKRGIRGELQGRTLLTHVEEEFQEQGLALSFSWEPDSSSNRGPSLSMSHAVGAAASGGMDALLRSTVMEWLDGPGTGQRFGAAAAYGFPALGDRLTLTPALVLALSPDSRSYSVLWSVAPSSEQAQGEPWEVALEGERQEHVSSATPTDHSLKLRFSLLF